MRTLEYTVPPQEAGRRLEYVLRAHFELSEHRLRSLKFADCILLDGAPAHVGRAVAAGQTVMVQLRDEGAALAPYDLPLRVPYRDADILIVDKPAPLPSIASARQDSATLENAVYACLGCPADFVYRPVSRLDKGTSGLMPIALNAVAHARMQRMLHTGQYVREYLAVTEGAPQADAGVIDRPIGHAEGVRRCIDPSGKHAVTHWKVLKRYGYVTLVECRLETGRTHQIRVHMAWIGHPLFNDERYGGDRILKGTTFAKYRQFIENCFAVMPRHALHARLLGFEHPTTHRDMLFECGLPDDFRALLEKWEGYAAAGRTDEE